MSRSRTRCDWEGTPKKASTKAWLVCFTNWATASSCSGSLQLTSTFACFFRLYGRLARSNNTLASSRTCSRRCLRDSFTTPISLSSLSSVAFGSRLLTCPLSFLFRTSSHPNRRCRKTFGSFSCHHDEVEIS